MAKPIAWAKQALVALLLIAVVSCAGFLIWCSDYYRADEVAEQVVATQAETNGSLVAFGDPQSEYGLVFYPGAKVQPEAYAPLAAKLAERGVFCVLVKMPLNIALFAPDMASQAMAAYPGVSHWWVGGHSLGGYVASGFAERNEDEVDGVALFAAYGDDDLGTSGLAVDLVYGTNDGVINQDALARCAASLTAEEVHAIEGANHAGFGNYGTHAGDGQATISTDEQQELAANAIVAAIMSRS